MKAAGPVPTAPAAESSAAGADGSPLALVFGDLLSAMTAVDAPSEGLAELELAAVTDEDIAPEAVAAGIQDLLDSLVRDDDGTGLPQLLPGVDVAGQGLLQPRPLAATGASEARLLAQDADRLSAVGSGLDSGLEGGLESRLARSDTAMVSGATASGTIAPPAGLLDALQSLATAGQQPAGTDAQGSSTLAAALQASAPERQLDSTAGRLPQPAPLPPQELRATVSQTLEQVAWMSREGVHQARLQLEPAHLGRVDIWLDLEGGEARLHLGAQQAQVREALEAVLPRLREALAEHGMNLTDASVSHSGRDNASGDSGRGDPASASTAFADDAGTSDQAESRPHDMTASGLLDIYA